MRHRHPAVDNAAARRKKCKKRERESSNLWCILTKCYLPGRKISLIYKLGAFGMGGRREEKRIKKKEKALNFKGQHQHHLPYPEKEKNGRGRRLIFSKENFFEDWVKRENYTLGRLRVFT